LARLKLSIW